jgi:hypothetical protein
MSPTAVGHWLSDEKQTWPRMDNIPLVAQALGITENDVRHACGVKLLPENAKLTADVAEAARLIQSKPDGMRLRALAVVRILGSRHRKMLLAKSGEPASLCRGFRSSQHRRRVRV